jgi:hypothetical protein
MSSGARDARLELSKQYRNASFLVGEKPFEPRFVEQSEPKKLRQNPFPMGELEFCICAANAFAGDGYTVLGYSPQKVGPAAREFRHMRGRGYLPDVKPPLAEPLTIASAIGREWLGEEHAAVRAPEVGVGTRHGALPRPFLYAVEELLDSRRLSIVVASPTLAQGDSRAVPFPRPHPRLKQEQPKLNQMALCHAKLSHCVGSPI